jgi:hypothetical protein
VEFAIPLLIAVVVALVVLVAVVRFTRRRAEHEDALRDAALSPSSPVEMLRYRVPEGRDPAPVLAALQRAGFEAIPDTEDTARHDILIPCQEGAARHREHVRAVIEDADKVNLEGDRAPVGAVRFTDE